MRYLFLSVLFALCLEAANAQVVTNVPSHQDVQQVMIDVKQEWTSTNVKIGLLDTVYEVYVRGLMNSTGSNPGGVDPFAVSGPTGNGYVAPSGYLVPGEPLMGVV